MGKLQPEFIENIKKVQQEVLQQYSRMVKPGGKMVYATCSILPSENQEQVKTFLTSDSGKDFTFVSDKKSLLMFLVLTDFTWLFRKK